MTKEILKAIRARCDSATAGPWGLSHQGFTIVAKAPATFVSLTGTNNRTRTPKAKNNAAFIAHSREDLPKLLDALEAGINALESYAVGWSGGVGNHAEHHERQYAEIRAARAREALAAIDRILSGEK